MICLSCSNCKYYTMKNGDSYCTKKREILTFLERNWTGSYSEYEFTCFRPSERTKYKHILMAFCFYLNEEHNAIVSFDDIGYEYIVKEFLQKCNKGEIDIK